MEIRRRGAERDHGETRVRTRVLGANFQADSKDVLLRCGIATDFVTDSKHTYKVVLPLSELVQILDALADGAMKNPGAAADELGKALRSLLQLQAVASGLVQVKPDDEI